MPQVTRLNVVERRMSWFLSEPPSVRTAAGVIVTATTVVVVGGGVLMRLLDHGDYSDVWVGMWWALQTVTTVGYGDVTPKNPSGRIIATFVMLQGIAFLAITTAAITSTFVARANKERDIAPDADEDDAEKTSASTGSRRCSAVMGPRIGSWRSRSPCNGSRSATSYWSAHLGRTRRSRRGCGPGRGKRPAVRLAAGPSFAL